MAEQSRDKGGSSPLPNRPRKPASWSPTRTTSLVFPRAPALTRRAGWKMEGREGSLATGRVGSLDTKEREAPGTLRGMNSPLTKKLFHLLEWIPWKIGRE